WAWSGRQGFARPRMVGAREEGVAGLLAAYGELEAEALDFFRREGFGEDGVILARAADMRYLGQEHTVRVPVPGGEPSLGEVVAGFAERHEGAFMFRLDAPAEFVSLHVAAMVHVPNPDLRAFAPSTDGGRAVKGKRRVGLHPGGVPAALVL